MASIEDYIERDKWHIKNLVKQEIEPVFDGVRGMVSDMVFIYKNVPIRVYQQCGQAHLWGKPKGYTHTIRFSNTINGKYQDVDVIQGTKAEVDLDKLIKFL